MKQLILNKETKWSLLMISYSLFITEILHKSSGETNDVTELEIDYRKKCFPFIGCYSCAPPFGGNIFYRSICNLPDDRLGIRYLLYTRLLLNESFHLYLGTEKLSPNETIAMSPIIPGLPLKILIPGFNSELPLSSEFNKIKDDLLKYKDFNVIIIDWTSDNNFPYEQAVANAREVGGLVALLVKLIHWNKNIEYENIHIIGHSLGAHIAGWIGRRVKGIGRITGLDPAGPYFQKAPHEVRLNKYEANFVDIIHTSGGNNIFQGLGLRQAIGDVDFYPNGGSHQPHCGESTVLGRE